MNRQSDAMTMVKTTGSGAAGILFPLMLFVIVYLFTLGVYLLIRSGYGRLNLGYRLSHLSH